VPPNISGINVNELLNRSVEPPVKRLISDDRISAVLAMRDSHLIDHFAGPGRLLAATDGDTLKSQSPKSKVVSLSNKSRAAIFSGGKLADIAIWSETMADPVQFATSSHYVKMSPTWLKDWNIAHPVTTYIPTWHAENPTLYAKVLGPHSASGKTNWDNLGKVFPHEIAKSKSPGKTYRTSPYATQHLIDLATAAVDNYALCEDAAADLLAISISSTDYAGHTFGVESWEYLDNFIRSDRIVGEFLSTLGKRCDFSAVLTADHGVASNPVRDKIADNHLVVPKDIARYLNDGISKVFGSTTSGWVKQDIEPFPIFLEAARVHPKFKEIQSLTLKLLKAHPNVHDAFYVKEARNWINDSDRVKRAVAMSIRPDQPEEIIFIVKAHLPFWPHEGGTSHGSPWDYDRLVPVIVAGPGYAASSVDTVERSMLQVAPTTLRLLGVQQPESMHELPLPY